MSLGYSLYPDYSALFSEASEKSDEIIFSVRFLKGAGHDDGETFSATYLGIPKVDSQPMPNLIKDYYCLDGLPVGQSSLYNPAHEKNNRDPRLAASIYFKGDIFITDPQKIFQGNTNTGYGQKKYIRSAPYADGTQPSAAGSQDFYLIRYADLLLMRAEALVESNNLSQEVYDLIDEVRSRVNMPKVEDVEGTGLDQDQLRKIVRHERRVELALEGLRFMDLKHWGVVNEAYQRLIDDNVTGYIPLYRGEKSETFPIPQSELDANKNLVQNQAWQ